MISRSLFGNDFKWGVSSSALQTEGNYPNDGKAASIWDEFAAKKRKIKRGHQPTTATDFYNHYLEDLDLITWMNCETFRFSIAWSRVLPEGTGKINQKGLDFYDRLIDDCLERSITPWITCYHWDLPAALQVKGGWVNREVLSWFTEYLELLLSKYADRVENWMVLNEPVAFTALGYFMGIHAPGKRGLSNFLPAMPHAALAQALGGRILKSKNVNLNVGTTFSFSPIEAYRANKKDESARVKVDALLNRLYLEPLLGLGYPLEELPGLKKVEKYFKEGDEKNLAFDFDFIGVQNYSREVVTHSYLTPIVNAKLITAKKRNVPRTAMKWELYPEGIYRVLKRLNEYKNIPPLFVTESGIALADQKDELGDINDFQRYEYYQNSIKAVLKAKEEGVNVKGFFCWSLSDNFEWAEGYHPRFGLIYIDYKTLERTPKLSAYMYRKFLKEIKI